uniref:Rubisco LSMT substrate-binding domain-containing protein n=1 Tax=Tetraselmis sp. GSL018 TaxID=582737 RepID=A0A061S8G6_9CHLO
MPSYLPVHRSDSSRPIQSIRPPRLFSTLSPALHSPDPVPIPLVPPDAPTPLIHLLVHLLPLPPRLSPQRWPGPHRNRRPSAPPLKTPVGSARAPRAGQEVTISYGSWPNDFFYLLFGFVPAGNPFDTVVLFDGPRDLFLSVNSIAKKHGKYFIEQGPELDAAVERFESDLGDGYDRLAVTREDLELRVMVALAFVAVSHPTLRDLLVEQCKRKLKLFEASPGLGSADKKRLSNNLRTSLEYCAGKAELLRNALIALGEA